MAKCDVCHKEMMGDRTLTCTERWFAKTENVSIETEDGVFQAGTQVIVRRADIYLDHERRCYDCNVGYGGFHHPGCDWERCPFCGLQLISCDCKFVVMTREQAMLVDSSIIEVDDAETEKE